MASTETAGPSPAGAPTTSSSVAVKNMKRYQPLEIDTESQVPIDSPSRGNKCRDLASLFSGKHSTLQLMGAVLIFLAFVSLCGLSIVGMALQSQERHSCSGQSFDGSVKNVVLMVGDGFGPAAQTLGRLYHTGGHGSMSLDSDILGSIRTYSSNSNITDSAAGGTAFSTGFKTNNRHVAVSPSGKPLATLFEAARSKGMLTGAVVTSSLSDATPASFTSHAMCRYDYEDIAKQQLTQGCDVLMGGGLDHMPNSLLMTAVRDYGYKLIYKREHLSRDDTHSADKLLGVFADGHMDFAIDRPSEQPSLMETTAVALDHFKRKGRPFLLLIEGSRIDQAFHRSDAAAAVREIVEYNEAYMLAREFAEESGDTLLLSVADHETGGLSLGNSDYTLDVEVLRKVKCSTHIMAMRVMGRGEDPIKVLQECASMTITEDEAARISARARDGDKWPLMGEIGSIVASRAHIAFTTQQHTGVDISLYGYGPTSLQLRGNHENTDIAKHIVEILGLDMQEATDTLEGMDIPHSRKCGY